MLFSGGRNLYKHRPIQQIVRQNTVDGLIIFNTRYTHQRFINSYIKALKERNFNFVIVHYYWGRVKINYVGIDYEQEAKKGISHLLSLGHKKIAFLSGTREAPLTARILKTFRQTLSQNGLAVSKKMIEYADYDYDKAYAKTLKILDVNPDVTAFFVAGFEMTPACIRAIKEKGCCARHPS